MESLNMDRAAPILIRIFKEESTLEVWKEDRTGKFCATQRISDLQIFRKARPEACPGRLPSA
jgi:murein L,D-transpeptidase YafK